MAKYIRWDPTNGRYAEIVGLPDPDPLNDERFLEYDDGTETWVAGKKIVVSNTEPTNVEDGDIWIDPDASSSDELIWAATWAKTLTMCEVNT
jgi:hypothetical protein